MAEEPSVFKNRHLFDDEETIEKTINYLKYHDPENANRNYAIGFLKFIQRMMFEVEKTQDLNYDDFLREFKKSEQNNSDLTD